MLQLYNYVFVLLPYVHFGKISIPGGGGGEFVKESVDLNWNFQRGGKVKTKRTFY